MNKKEAYEALKMETIRFQIDDIIVTSDESLETPLDDEEG